MSTAKNSRSNQIAFLSAFCQIWDITTTEEYKDATNGHPDNAKTNALTNILQCFLTAAGLPQIPADELLSELQEMPTLMTWKQLQKANEVFDASGVTTPQNWLWDKLDMIDCWYPVIDLTKDTKRFLLVDKTGRGFTNNDASIDQVLELNEEGDQNLQQWAIDAIEGDVWYNGAIRIECITN